MRLLGAINRRLDEFDNERKRAMRGAKGEELIGEILDELDDDFLVFHDLSSPYGNIDHLVLSKEKGLFLIETKAHTGRVSIVNSELKINQRNPEKDFIAQVLRNTIWLGQQLEARLLTTIWINPILVFANAYAENCKSIRNIQVVPKLFLLKTIQKRSRSRGALKLWENKEILSEIFPSVWFPPKADLDLSPLKSSQLPPPGISPKIQNGMRSPIRLTHFGAVYRLISSDDQKPSDRTGSAN